MTYRQKRITAIAGYSLIIVVALALYALDTCAEQFVQCLFLLSSRPYG